MLNDSLFISLSQFTAIPKQDFYVSFCKEKQFKILHSHFYQRLTLNTKKSDICCCDFNIFCKFIFSLIWFLLSERWQKDVVKNLANKWNKIVLTIKTYFDFSYGN